MTKSSPPNIQLDDIQALLRFGHGRLIESAFLLLKIRNPALARNWLSQAEFNNATRQHSIPSQAVQVAFTVEGLRAMGLDNKIIEGFSDEFISGMHGDESRSRRLGDIGDNAPENWAWGHEPDQFPHMLLMLYSEKDGMPTLRSSINDEAFQKAFEIQRELPTAELRAEEPFGFVDGISQPKVDWEQQQSTDIHKRDHYSNLLAPGEVMLGYANEYGLYTPRPLIDAQDDPLAAVLPDAQDQPAKKDFARNGSYLVVRQLQQDVPGFWKYVDKATNSEQEREQLAAKMVGRQRDGTPLVTETLRRIPGIEPTSRLNHFSYDLDADGVKCPVTAHIRRSNPRSGDYPADVSGFWSRLLRLLGFGQQRDDEDLVASSRFHRLLRRGRAYGPVLTPQAAMKSQSTKTERGLQFICLVANISRQFEFVQNAWNMSSNFAGLQNERDPIMGTREPLIGGTDTDQFKQPQESGLACRYKQLPQFVTVRGGAYFFMPGIRALKYLASIEDPNRETGAQHGS